MYCSYKLQMDPFNKGELTESITISNPNITGSLFSKGILKPPNLALVQVVRTYVIYIINYLYH
jgi:hypothetical protein